MVYLCLEFCMLSWLLNLRGLTLAPSLQLCIEYITCLKLPDRRCALFLFLFLVLNNVVASQALAHQNVFVWIYTLVTQHAHKYKPRQEEATQELHTVVHQSTPLEPWGSMEEVVVAGRWSTLLPCSFSSCVAALLLLWQRRQPRTSPEGSNNRSAPSTETRSSR